MAQASSPQRLLRCEVGGTGLVELLLVVSLVALVGIAAAQVYGISVRDQFSGDGGEVDHVSGTMAVTPAARGPQRRAGAERGELTLEVDGDETAAGDDVPLAPAPGVPSVLVAATRVLGTVLTPLAWWLEPAEAERELVAQAAGAPASETLRNDEDAVAAATAPTHAARRPPRTPVSLGDAPPARPSNGSFAQLSWWVLLAIGIAALLLPTLRAIVRRWRSGDSTASPRATSPRTGAWSRSSCAAATSPPSTSSKLST